MPLAEFGHPLTGSFSVPGGTAQFYERGLAITGTTNVVEVAFAFPLIGLPNIVTSEAGPAQVFEPTAITFQIGGWQEATFLSALRTACARLRLSPVGKTMSPVSLELGERVTTSPARAGVQATYGVPASATLQHRQLYDVSVQNDDGTLALIAPHAVYFRTSWHDFGIAHVTDIHIARRIDYFPARLEAAGRPDTARTMSNWNDRFRGFIRYANYLHSSGILDVILATGDLMDYQMEDDDPGTSAGGNALYVRDLLLGAVPSKHFPDVEELRVPIFMVPGNHDFRRYTYPLVATVVVGPIPAHTIAQHSGLKLNAEEALIAMGATSMPSISGDTAGLALVVDPKIPDFRRYLANKANYLIQLGQHRIAMLDTGPDTGLPTNAEALADFLSSKGLPSPGVKENATTAIDGSPNSSGIGPEALKLVVDGLDEAPENGLFIVGLHAPLINPWNEEYPYFFRETLRTAQSGEVYRWLERQDGFSANTGIAHSRHPLWFSAGPNPDAATFLKRGDPEDLLDYGVARGGAYDLLKAIAGLGHKRAADVVLQGHIHRFCDFRLSAVEGELACYMDFYTQNFSHYYPVTFSGGTTYVDIVADAYPHTQPSRLPHRDDKFIITVPPYPNPLSSATDPRGWWAEHRPLVLETEALGPFKNGDANLAGFRVLSVKNDVIEKINFVSIEALHASNYRMEWNDVIKPDQPNPYIHSQRSKEFSLPAAGSPCGFVLPSSGTQDIIYRNAAGGFLELWRDSSGKRGFGYVSGAVAAPSAADDPTCYIDSSTGKVVVPYRGTDNQVHTLNWGDGPGTGHDALSASVKAPQAVGRPVGYFNQARKSHMIVYRSGNNNLHALSWSGAVAALHEDLTAGAHAIGAASNPAAYLDTKRGTNIVVYRAIDAHIRSIYWSEGPSGLDDLSGFTQGPFAQGDPVAYYVPNNDTHHVVYRSAGGHLIEIYWNGTSPAAQRDLTVIGRAPSAASDACAWYNPAADIQHVAYLGNDGHVYDIRGKGDGSFTLVDLSMESLAAPAAGAPFGFNGPSYQHVVYRGKDGEIHEIRWAEAGIVPIFVIDELAKLDFTKVQPVNVVTNLEVMKAELPPPPAVVEPVPLKRVKKVFRRVNPDVD